MLLGEGGEESKRSKEREDEEEISFSNKSQSCCVCFVSMIDSIETTILIRDPDKVRRYYSVFINTMAAIARNFDGKVIKNTGTSLIYYFPKTSDASNLSAFNDVIECGVTMMVANKIINIKLKEEGLPSLQYKISADYGIVEVARSLSSPATDDFFGSTMNVCAKINSMAHTNGMVIDSGLYHIVNKFSSSFSTTGQCYFQKVGEYSITGRVKHQYTVYSVIVGVEEQVVNILDVENQIPKLQKSAPENQSIEHEGGEIKEQQQQQKNASTTIIMLVDDEPDTMLTYKTFLIGGGYNVDTFTDPKDALTHFAQVNPNNYNLVVMDIRMPNLNGIQLYYRMKAINPDIKILFVSALDAAQEMVSILPDVGVQEVIKKPVDQKQFLYKIKTAAMK